MSRFPGMSSMTANPFGRPPRAPPQHDPAEISAVAGDGDHERRVINGFH
jgi:hypothetical protein